MTFSSTYYQITTTRVPGYPSRFLCTRCFDLREEYERAAEIERVHAQHVDSEEIGTFCDMCNAPLASPSADVTVETIDVDALMAIAEGK